MPFLKKNLWLVFYVLTLFFVVYIALISYSQWQRIFTQAQISQENNMRLVVNSTQSLYKTNEIMLDILGYSFIYETAYPEDHDFMTILDAALEGSPAIISIALVDPEGNFLFATNDRDVSDFPNLFEQPQTRDTFIEVINSDSMVFGRTYFFEPFQDWIVPIRKAIRRPNGSVHRIITAALRLEDSFGHIIEKSEQMDDYLFLIVRDDMYVQYGSMNTSIDYSIYLEALPHDKRDFIQSAIYKMSDSTQEYNWYPNQIYTFITDYEESKRLISLQYSSDYKFWFILMTEMNVLWRNFLRSLVAYIFVFLFIVFPASSSFPTLPRLISAA